MTRQQPTRPTEWKTEKHRFAVRSSLRSNDAPELISLPLFLPWPIMLSSLSLKPQNKMSPSGMAAWQGPPASHLFPRRGGKKNHQKGQRGECGAVSCNDRKVRFMTQERSKFSNKLSLPTADILKLAKHSAQMQRKRSVGGASLPVRRASFNQPPSPEIFIRWTNPT